jgi:hypothetical protein
VNLVGEHPRVLRGGPFLPRPMPRAHAMRARWHRWALKGPSAGAAHAHASPQLVRAHPCQGSFVFFLRVCQGSGRRRVGPTRVDIANSPHLSRKPLTKHSTSAPMSFLISLVFWP